MFFLIATLWASGSDQTPMNYEKYSGHDNYWKMVPKIIICKNKVNFTKKQIEAAVKIWKKPYSTIEEKNNCNYELERGKIKIVDGKYLKERQWGYTSYLYSNREENGKNVKAFSSALVQLDKSIDNENILIHEIGHAFGINHYDHSYDIMNSYASY